MSTHTLTESGLAQDAGRKIKESIEATREKVDRTVHDLSERLDPRRVVDGIAEWAKDASMEDVLVSAKQVASHVRRHPLPYTLAGAGMAWLAIELIRRHGHDADGEWKERSVAAKDAAVEAFHRAGESAGRAVKEGRAALVAGAGEARRTLARKYDKASEACQDACHSATEKASRKAGTIADAAAHNPIAVGSGLLALGLLAGFLLPRTRTEDKWIRDRDVEA